MLARSEEPLDPSRTRWQGFLRWAHPLWQRLPPLPPWAARVPIRMPNVPRPVLPPLPPWAARALTWLGETHASNMRTLAGWLSDALPKGLYARALIIIIAPIVVLEGVVAFVFMERHWQAVTRRLSEATARNIAALIDIYEENPRKDDYSRLIEMARDRLNLSMQILPPGDLPAPRPKPFFALLDQALSDEIRRQVKRPFWIDTVGQSRHVEIRVKHANSILRFVATRSQTYASNSHIFLLWMIGSSVILLTVAILFLRNQIRPILRLAEAADAFGKGRKVPRGLPPARRPRGAPGRGRVPGDARPHHDPRRAAHNHARRRQPRPAHGAHPLQAGAGAARRHGGGAVAADRRARDAEHARGLSGLRQRRRRRGIGSDQPARAAGGDPRGGADLPTPVELKIRKRREEIVLPLKRQAFKRAITNLVSNAMRYGDRVLIRAAVEGQWVRVEVDDNGPGIPPSERANVFKPFYRLDHARNQDESNTGLGLAIARDIAKSHGGDITLGESSMGGLRAIISVPL